VLEFSEKYNDGVLKEPDLDEYFLHDRAVRESGHDTTYRFEKRCANLATVDLNALLFKCVSCHHLQLQTLELTHLDRFEIDIGTAIKNVFDDELDLDDDFVLQPFPYTTRESALKSSLSRKQTSAEWLQRAEYRRAQMDEYFWNEGKSLYFDYDTVTKRQSLYESVTAFWALWAGCASEEQAWRLM